MNDTWVGSLIWGRVGGGILALSGAILGAYGFEFGAEDQEALYTIVSGSLSSIGAIMAIISKMREQRRGK